jgi:hypothetical protein
MVQTKPELLLHFTRAKPSVKTIQKNSNQIGAVTATALDPGYGYCAYFYQSTIGNNLTGEEPWAIWS